MLLCEAPYRIANNDIPAKPTFAPKDYHRPGALSLLCSEWEEVGHTSVNHWEVAGRNSGTGFGLPAETLVKAGMGTLLRSPSYGGHGRWDTRK